MAWFVLLCSRRHEERVKDCVSERTGSATAAKTSTLFPGMVFVRKDYAEDIAAAIAESRVPGALDFVGGTKPTEISDGELDAALACGPDGGSRPGVKVSFSWLGRRR